MSTKDSNPRANVFILLNLGCEMLYVIDQRLKAQQIKDTIAAKVMKEISSLLLDDKFVQSLMKGSIDSNGKLLTPELCQFLLKDVALSSIMQLDQSSMNKLWNLMIMIYKWQLFQTSQPHHLMDVTFRHLDGILKLYPNQSRFQLADFVKNLLLEFWNSSTDAQQAEIYQTNKAWLEHFNTRVSLLVRLGFQQPTGEFISKVPESYFQEMADSIGDNIYIQAANIAARHRLELADEQQNKVAQQISTLAGLFNQPLSHTKASSVSYNEANLDHCNLILNNLSVHQRKSSDTESEFMQLETVNKRKFQFK